MNRYFREISVTIALGLVLLAMAVFAPGFFQPQPLLSLVTREAPTLVVACGMVLVIICRQIDISVGSRFSVCSICAGLLTARGWPLGAVLPTSMAVGALLGSSSVRLAHLFPDPAALPRAAKRARTIAAKAKEKFK